MHKLRRLVYDYVMRRCIKWMDGKKDQALTDSMYWYGIHIERMSSYEVTEAPKCCKEKDDADYYIANMVAEHEAELDKWYAKLCRNRWRRAYAMYQHCCVMNRFECDTSPSTMNMHQFWRYHTAYWSRWMKRWLKVYLEYKERIK